MYQSPVPDLADRVGFEPTVPLLVHLISSQGRYDRFDTCPCLRAIIPNPCGKIKRFASFFLRPRGKIYKSFI